MSGIHLGRLDAVQKLKSMKKDLECEIALYEAIQRELSDNRVASYLALDRCRKAREECQFVTFILEAFERQESHR